MPIFIFVGWGVTVSVLKMVERPQFLVDVLDNVVFRPVLYIVEIADGKVMVTLLEESLNALFQVLLDLNLGFIEVCVGSYSACR